MMDPQRRRLTVGIGGAAAAARRAAGRVPDDDDEEGNDPEAEDLEAVLNSTDEIDGRPRYAALVSSRTEKICVNPYLEKTIKVQHTDGFRDASESKNWLKSHGIGWCCKKGMKPDSKNQDSFSLLVVEGSFALYCVYDGHGPFGHSVSDAVRMVLVSAFLHHELRETNVNKALDDVFSYCQERVEALHEEKKLDAKMSGTTCTVVYHDFKRNALTIAHVGDSRAVVGKVKGAEIVVEETVDHKPDLQEERDRIENAEPPGKVIFDGFYNYRVFAQDGPYPGLNMSRAIGDIAGQEKAGLTWKPAIKTIHLDEECFADADQLLLLVCTDGVWEFLENKVAIKMALDELNRPPPEDGWSEDNPPAQQIMEVLAKESYDRWMKDSEDEISDDITGIMVDLRTLQQRTLPASRDAVEIQS